jgi:antitoxin HigA-1
MKPMKKPPHPGEIVRDLCIEPLGLTVKQAAEGLGISRKVLSDILNGHAGVTATMALRLAKAFGSTAETWLGLQSQHDLAAARKKNPELKVLRLAALPVD